VVGKGKGLKPLVVINIHNKGLKPLASFSKLQRKQLFMMTRLKPLYVVLALIALVLIVAVTALLVPSETNPAFATAVNFVNASGKGDDALAIQALAPVLQDYVMNNCPDDSVSACIDAYTPAEWGKFLSAVFRRAQPDGAQAWDIQLVATYELGQGFSGVCMYNRVEQLADNTWQITRWSGWMSCDEANSGLTNLISDPTVPNRAP
jgi:hypothetical protein